MPTRRSLEDAFAAIIRRQFRPENLLPQIIVKGLAEQGILLSAGNVAALKRQIKVRGRDQLSIEIDDKGYPGLSESAVRQIVEKFFKDLGPRVNKFLDRMRRQMPSLLDVGITSLAEAALKEVRKKRRRALRSNRGAHEAFRNQQAALWGEALDALELPIGIVTDVWMHYCQKNEHEYPPSGRRVRYVLIRLHARAYAYWMLALAQPLPEKIIRPDVHEVMNEVTRTLSAKELAEADAIISNWKSQPTPLTQKVYAGLDRAQSLARAARR
jgi:hypothetical protein